uniref:Uncharacterized protein n=1 Tax=Trichinella nativa TaxID=6335 RepID=A0A0V1KJ63_9BILA
MLCGTCDGLYPIFMSENNLRSVADTDLYFFNHLKQGLIWHRSMIYTKH